MIPVPDRSLLRRRAAVYARCAQEAYSANPQVGGLPLIGLLDRGETQVAVFGCRNETVVAFRGTSALWDLLVDLRYVKADCPSGGRVHAGFQAALDQVWNDLSVILERSDLPVTFTGHSLGGALAILAAARHPLAKRAVTFGAPLVGNQGFAATLLVPVWRFENSLDLVTWVPFRNSPVQALHACANGRRPTGYVKDGTVIRLDGWRHPMSGYVAAVHRWTMNA